MLRTIQKGTLPQYYFSLNPSNTRGRQPGLSGDSSMRKIPFSEFPEETQEGFTFALNLAGIRKEDIAVVIDDGQLVVEAEREFDPDQVVHSNWEKSYGVFTRRFDLPDSIDQRTIRYVLDGDHLYFTLLKEGVTHPERSPQASRHPDAGTRPPEVQR